MDTKLDLPEIPMTSTSQWDDDMTRRLVSHVASKGTDLVDKPFYIDPAVYTDPARFEAEKRGIFGQLPLLACLSSDIAAPGDFILFEELGRSIIVARGRDGQVHAFLNMCTHRAARLVSECGSAKRFTCPFHAWTFDLGGKLIGVPRKEAFDPADLAGRDLRRVPVGEWGGLVFIKTHAGDERIDVEAHLGSFAPVIGSLGFDRASLVKQGRLDFAANWKYALDTYGEGYHVGFLHAQTVGSMYYGDVLAVERYGPHHHMGFATNAFGETTGKEEADWPSVRYSPVYFIFPNIAINVQPMPDDRAFIAIQTIYPGESMHEGYTRMKTYKRGGPLGEAERQEYEAGHDLIMKVVGTEDFSVSAGGYANLRYAPPGFRPVFGRNEHPAAEVQRNIARIIGMPI